MSSETERIAHAVMDRYVYHRLAPQGRGHAGEMECHSLLENLLFFAHRGSVESTEERINAVPIDPGFLDAV